MTSISVTLTMALTLAQDADLDAMAAAKDAATYTAARDRVVAMGRDALPALTAAGAADKWTPAGWVRALAAESCRTRIADPDLAAAVDSPRGLDPATYREFRRPEPMVVPELSRRRVENMPLLIERWRWTFDAFPFSAGAAGDLERTRFREGILEVIGAAADARARYFLAEVLAAGPMRGQAAVSLGPCAGIEALAPLAAVLDNRAEGADVREACARALGRVADDRALDAIKSRLGAAQDEDAQVRRSLITGLGILGTEWTWKARGRAFGPMADRIRKGCAEALVEALKRWPGESDALGMALALTAWAPSQEAVEAIAGDDAADAQSRSAARAVLEPLKMAVARQKK